MSLDELAKRIIDFMSVKNYKIFEDLSLYNIVYVEGMNTNGILNQDVPNHFNDIRTVIAFEDGVPKIIGIWEATTEPGSKYTHRPLNPKGAARIAFGQYTAWQVGRHKDHEALIQVAPVTVFRDANRDFVRTADKADTGLFGINQHWGYDLPRNEIAGASAGCLVGRSTQGHREFMTLVKSDKRYLADREFIFSTAILPGDKI